MKDYLVEAKINNETTLALYYEQKANAIKKFSSLVKSKKYTEVRIVYLPSLYYEKSVRVLDYWRK